MHGAPPAVACACRPPPRPGRLAPVNALLNLLAVAGGAAAAWHVIRAASRFLRGGATGIWTEEMGRTHARRGDLTSLDETQREHRAAAMETRRWGLLALGWLLVLAAPSLTPWARPLYASYSAFWLGPLVRRRRSAA
jgi:hypothetical protein